MKLITKIVGKLPVKAQAYAKAIVPGVIAGGAVIVNAAQAGKLQLSDLTIVGLGALSSAIVAIVPNLTPTSAAVVEKDAKSVVEVAPDVEKAIEAVAKAIEGQKPASTATASKVADAVAMATGDATQLAQTAEKAAAPTA